ncbi:MAG TPA: hypothetical protein VHD62_10110 [Opitutaceae bacterium]|nr:hypothetical protein [Opitutaceae bacterium]
MIRLRFLPLLLTLGAARLSASMIDEIQVYTDDINAPGKFGLELHLNTTLQGRSTPDYPGEITPQHGVRLTPEFSYGLTKTFEAGLYVPMQRAPDGGNDLAGLKLRLKWLPVQPDEKNGGWFAGANLELSRLQTRFEEGHWSTELRTMIGWRAADWLLAANPVFGWTLAGPDRAARPDFDLQLKASREIAKGISFGPEYYAGFGPIFRSSGFADQDHSLFAAFDVDLKPWVFNFGIGRGVSHAADRWTAKFIFEVPW